MSIGSTEVIIILIICLNILILAGAAVVVGGILMRNVEKRGRGNISGGEE